MRNPLLAAAGVFAVIALASGPVAAQTAFLHEIPTVTVQNNHQHHMLRVYLQEKDHPTDITLGFIPPMQVLSLGMPGWAVENKSQVGLVVQTNGGTPLEGEAVMPELDSHYSMMIGHTGRVIKNESKMWTTAPFDATATTVTVRNESKHPRTAFMQSGFIDQKLGEVPAYSEVTFTVPDGFVGQSGRVSLVNDYGSAVESSMLDLEQGRHFGVRLK